MLAFVPFRGAPADEMLRQSYNADTRTLAVGTRYPLSTLSFNAEDVQGEAVDILEVKTRVYDAANAYGRYVKVTERLSRSVVCYS